MAESNFNVYEYLIADHIISLITQKQLNYDFIIRVFRNKD